MVMLEDKVLNIVSAYALQLECEEGQKEYSSKKWMRNTKNTENYGHRREC